MTLARLIQINAVDAALLSAVPPKALPRPSRVPLSFFALDNSQDHQRLAFSALTPEQIQTSVTRLGGSVANACSGMRMASDREETKSSLVSSNGRFLSKRSGQKLFNGTPEQIELGARLGAGHTRRWNTIFSSSIRTPRRLKSSSVPFRNARRTFGLGHGICLLRRTIIIPPCRRADGDTRSDLLWLSRAGADKSAPSIEMHDFGIEPELKSAM